MLIVGAFFQVQNCGFLKKMGILQITKSPTNLVKHLLSNVYKMVISD